MLSKYCVRHVLSEHIARWQHDFHNIVSMEYFYNTIFYEYFYVLCGNMCYVLCGICVMCYVGILLRVNLYSVLA